MENEKKKKEVKMKRPKIMIKVLVFLLFSVCLYGIYYINFGNIFAIATNPSKETFVSAGIFLSILILCIYKLFKKN